MGLDSIELVMEIEDEFDIAIPDDVAEAITTVGALTRYVQDQVGRQTEDPCASMVRYHAFRKTFCAITGARRSQVRPRARLNRLFDERTLGELWPTLKTGFNLPSLPLVHASRRRLWLRVGAGIGCALACVGFAIKVVDGDPGSGRGDVIAALGVIAAIVMLTCAGLQRGLQSDMSCRSLFYEADESIPQAQDLRNDAIAARVRTIIAEQFGVDAASLRPSTRFIEDLDMA